MFGFISINPNSLPAEDKQPPRIDILIFSPHPEDETIACAGVILKALQENKTIKIVFLTNGETPIRAYSAQNAAKKLGLSAQDEIFLSFPDKGLLPLWEERYELTFARGKKGYNRRNVLTEIKNILTKYQPKKVYMPHSLGLNNDHQATAYFVNRALEELKKQEEKWLIGLEVSNYLIHGFLNDAAVLYSQPPSQLNSYLILSQAANSKINISRFKWQKETALNEYCIQPGREKGKVLLKKNIKEEEIFWDVPNDKGVYLNQLEQEWLGIAKIMRRYGFNVNFGPVVDLAGKIEDRDIYLVQRYRLYSDNPDKVIELTSRVIEGMNKAGIIPVLKHFPGLGGVHLDTHIQLPILEKTKASLENADLVPFKKLINKYPNLWVMVDHVIYPALSDKPASLSYDIQTTLLRKELGFTGIIIADELFNMQALLEFAYREKIPEPIIGEIIVRAFQAGTDIALIYPPPEKAEGIISHIIQSVMKAVNAGRLNQEEMNNSLERILKEKERVFGKPLRQLIKDMPLEERICQKIALDFYNDTKLLNKYNLCGIHPRLELDIKALQNQVKIPMFIMAQHEGGAVNERLLKLSTRSAYVVGREFERLADKNAAGNCSGTFSERPLQRRRRAYSPNRPKNTNKNAGILSSKGGNKDRQYLPSPALKGADYDKDISSLLVSMDKLIELFSELWQKGTILPPPPNYLTPLTVNSDNSFELKPFNRLPVVWLRSFPDEAGALQAYNLFKNIYHEWMKKYDSPASGISEVVSRLISLRESIKRAGGAK